MTKQPMTDAEAARYIAHTHPLTKQSDEKPEDFVLRIVRAYDNAKRTNFGVPHNRREPESTVSPGKVDG